MKKKKLASAYKLTMQIKSLLTILFLLCVLHQVFFFFTCCKIEIILYYQLVWYQDPTIFHIFFFPIK